jgi:hypothetical protein
LFQIKNLKMFQAVFLICWCLKVLGIKLEWKRFIQIFVCKKCAPAHSAYKMKKIFWLFLFCRFFIRDFPKSQNFDFSQNVAKISQNPNFLQIRIENLVGKTIFKSFGSGKNRKISSKKRNEQKTNKKRTQFSNFGEKLLYIFRKNF